MKKFFRIFRISAVILAFAAAFFVLHKPAETQTDDCILDKEAAVFNQSQHDQTYATGVQRGGY